jgi:hypothetical protein
MYNSALVKSGRQVLSSNATFLNNILAAGVPHRCFASTAFNVKSKFEAAFNAKKTAKGTQTTKV